MDKWILWRYFYLTQARRRQWADRESLTSWQWERLKVVLRDAYNNIPFYKKYFEEAGVCPDGIKSWQDFRRLPCLSKESVKEAGANGSIIDKRYMGDSISRTTSGSSGFPTTVYYDKKSYAFSEAIYARALFEQGVSIFDRIAYFWYEPFRQRGIWEHLGLFRKNEILYTQDEERQLEQLLRLRPTVVHCFPSTLYIIGQIMKRKGLQLRPRVVITHGELLLDPVRKAIEEAFAAPVLDQYGSNEFNRMAWECKEVRNYHIDADSILVEFLDENNEEVAPGERGRLVVTHLVNRMMPLIRYEMGDFAIKTNEVCRCGRGLPLLKNIEGRRDDFIALSGGRVMSPRTLGGLMEQVGGLRWYHIIQQNYDKFVVQMIPGDGCREETARNIRQILANALGGTASIEVIIVSDSVRTRTGKRRAIESALSKVNRMNAGS